MQITAAGPDMYLAKSRFGDPLSVPGYFKSMLIISGLWLALALANRSSLDGGFPCCDTYLAFEYCSFFQKEKKKRSWLSCPHVRRWPAWAKCRSYVTHSLDLRWPTLRQSSCLWFDIFTPRGPVLYSSEFSLWKRDFMQRIFTCKKSTRRPELWKSKLYHAELLLW